MCFFATNLEKNAAIYCFPIENAIDVLCNNHAITVNTSNVIRNLCIYLLHDLIPSFRLYEWICLYYPAVLKCFRLNVSPPILLYFEQHICVFHFCSLSPVFAISPATQSLTNVCRAVKCLFWESLKLIFFFSFFFLF